MIKLILAMATENLIRRTLWFGFPDKFVARDKHDDGIRGLIAIELRISILPSASAWNRYLLPPMQARHYISWSNVVKCSLSPKHIPSFARAAFADS